MAARLPEWLEPDTFDGAAWIGLVPFRLTMWTGSFPELNLRTYVRGPDGRHGIWFFSLDATRPDAVAFARHLYRLPYMWCAMHIDGGVRYRMRRRWPGPARADIDVERLEAIEEPSALERFLTNRWRLYMPGRRVLHVEHEPWALWRARVLHASETVCAAAGLPPLGDDLVAHWSPGVRARFSRSKRLRPRALTEDPVRRDPSCVA